MKINSHIDNLDALDKEIFRQELATKEPKRQFEKDQDHLRDNFFTLAMNSIKKDRRKENGHSSFLDHLFNNDHVKETVSGITDRITDHANDAINNLIDRLFQKHR